MQLEGLADHSELLEQLRQFHANAQEDRLQLNQMASAKTAAEEERDALKAKFGSQGLSRAEKKAKLLEEESRLFKEDTLTKMSEYTQKINVLEEELSTYRDKLPSDESRVKLGQTEEGEEQQPAGGLMTSFASLFLTESEVRGAAKK